MDIMFDFISSARSSSVMLNRMAFRNASASIFSALSIWLPREEKRSVIWLCRFVLIWPMACSMAAPSWVCNSAAICSEKFAITLPMTCCMAAVNCSCRAAVSMRVPMESFISCWNWSLARYWSKPILSSPRMPLPMM